MVAMAFAGPKRRRPPMIYFSSLSAVAGDMLDSADMASFPTCLTRCCHCPWQICREMTLSSLDGRGGGGDGNGGDTGFRGFAGKPTCIWLARQATQAAAMPKNSFCSPEAMAGVVQGGDGERR